MGYCGEQTLSTTEGADKVAVTLRCRSWGCDECREQRRRELIALALDGRPNKLLTLTSRRRPDFTPEQAAHQLVKAWRLIRRRWHRENKPQRIEFLAIFEATRRGWPHLHILLRCKFIAQGWLSAQMAELADSPVVDIRDVSSKRGVARYVSKYTAKGPGKFGKLKRYWHSAGYELSIYEPQHATVLWDRQNLSLRAWCEAWRTNGWTVVIESHHKARAKPPC
jgi:hypothetical protein